MSQYQTLKSNSYNLCIKTSKWLFVCRFMKIEFYFFLSILGKGQNPYIFCKIKITLQWYFCLVMITFRHRIAK